MVKKLEAIKVINVDGIPIAVDSMSDDIKQLVLIFDGWNQREEDARDELMMIQSAKESISRNIVNQVRTEQDKQKETETPSSDEVSNDGATDDETAAQ